MSDFRFDSFCGLYCGACDILNAYKNGLDSGIAPEWSDLPIEFKNLPFKGNKVEIKCHGCKTENIFFGCSKCIIRKCAIKKEGIDTCLDCLNYPCWRIKIAIFLRKILKFDKKLPHLKSIDDNVQTIKNHGIKYWMEEQERKWKCTSCGKQLSWYKSSCIDCNTSNENNI